MEKPYKILLIGGAWAFAGIFFSSSLLFPFDNVLFISGMLAMFFSLGYVIHLLVFRKEKSKKGSVITTKSKKVKFE